ncbi:MAG: hypothetical protein M1822_005744 [Bathelium mastoideum]|nr:MAG: hypothetical protein M1822_005744 [Bathelium mastoideum]
MRLAEEETRLFFAVVPVFVAALPPSPGTPAQRQHVDRQQERRHNAITILRLEIQKLLKSFTRDHAAYDLSEDAFSKASNQLEYILVLLEEWVDDAILEHERRVRTDERHTLPKLQTLETIIGASTQFPDEILECIKYPVENASPVQYLKISNLVEHFNGNMQSLYGSNVASTEPDMIEAEATEVYQDDTEEDRTRAKAEVERALRLCGTTSSIAKVFVDPCQSCRPPHSAHIHLSGFEEPEIDMLISVCGGRGPTKWHFVHWTNSSNKNLQQTPTNTFCSALQEARKCRARLRIQIHGDGSWSKIPGRTRDLDNGAAAPRKTLQNWLDDERRRETTQEAPFKMMKKDMLRLALTIARSSLYLLGSPLLQDPWKTESIYITETGDESRIKPYISGQLTGCLGEEQFEQSQRAKSSILHLGLLLWELFFGKKVEVTEEDIEDEDDDGTDSLFNALHRDWLSLEKSVWLCINPWCLKIIGKCLTLYGEARIIDAGFRTNLYCDIIKPLIMYLEHYSPPKTKPIATVKRQVVMPPWDNMPSNMAFDQQRVLYMKPEIMKKQPRPFEAHVNRWQRYVPSIRSSLSSMTTANGRQGQKRMIPWFPTHELSQTFDSKNLSGDTSSHRSKFKRQKVMSCVLSKNYTLFDGDSQAYEESAPLDPNTEDFTRRMTTFIEDNILPLPEELGHNITLEPQKRSIRIAVLDTGIRVDESDELLKSGQDRIILKRNFISEDKQACWDSYGHGTHVARLLLRFAPSAEIVVAKVSESKDVSGVIQIVDALKWAKGPDCNADIIVMSFGLGQNPIPEMQSLIETLVNEDKLIFAAASNGGGNEHRAFPAKEDGVFCIHVSDGKGNKTGTNPPCVDGDNFSTLGFAIDSKWEGKEVHINGSSYAVPVAAAIAANALEFIRHTLTEPNDKPGYFYNYQGMRNLFCCLADSMDGYNYVKPWKRYLWDDEMSHEKICSSLRHIVAYGPEHWNKKTSESSFKGFHEHVRPLETHDVHMEG